MKLVKVLYEGRIVNFWLSKSGEKFSPLFATKERALEWLTAYLYASYRGIERRISVIDRRADRVARDDFSKHNKLLSIAPYGRRASDNLEYEIVDQVSDFVLQVRDGDHPEVVL